MTDEASIPKPTTEADFNALFCAEVGGEQEAPAEDDEEMQALPLSGGPGVLGLDLVGEGLHPLPNGVRGQKLGVRRRGFSRHGRGTRDPMRGEIRDRRTARR